MSTFSLFEKVRNSRASRITCAFLALNLLAEIVSPSAAMALTSGPSQPEFSSFEPVATTDMVNDLNGDFTYNVPVLSVPGPEGGGYSMSLSYHSGASSEEDASWVGFGWTLNPGAINRNKRGYADEFYNTDVVTYNKNKPSISQMSKFDFDIEPVSQDEKTESKGGDAGKSTQKMKVKFSLPQLASPDGGGGDDDDFPVSVSFSHSISYNNYSGFTIGNSAGLSVKNIGNLNISRSGAQTKLGFSVNPGLIMEGLSKVKMARAILKARQKFNNVVQKLRLRKTVAGLKRSLISNYVLKTYNVPALPFSVAKHSAASWNFSASIQINPNIPVGFQVGMAGNLDVQANEGVQTRHAYGYMNSAYANNHTLSNSQAQDILYDYQVEKDGTFDKHDKNLGIPFNNSDVFSASGNDVNGGFRFIQKKAGSYYPNFSSSVKKIRQLSIELGIGATFQIGIDLGVGKGTTDVGGRWKDLVGLSGLTDYTKQAFDDPLPQMRFSEDMGGELDYDGDYDTLLFATINFDKSLDLSKYGLALDANKNYSSSNIKYTLQDLSKTSVSTQTGANLITGIEVTSKDGSKNNFGQPVYTQNEEQMSIGLESNNDGSYLVTHQLNLNDPLKHKSAVGEKVTQKYASTFLLTDKRTFNYVDIGGDGIDDKDYGGWTKFGYRQVTWGADNWYRFRAPYNGLTYNANRMLDDKDQTGSMSCGEKEIYYLKCIETKSHIAFFVTNAMTASTFSTTFTQANYPYLYDSSNLPISTVTNNVLGSGTTRYDAVDAAPVTAGMDLAAESLTATGSHHLEKLERIVLFAKSDLSKPLSTTYFEYDYNLCQGIPNTDAPAPTPKGKLTLKRLWTESYGVTRSQIAPYQFHYEYFNQYPNTTNFNQYYWTSDYNAMPSNDANQNPIYHPEQLDGWGNFQEDGAARFAKMQHWVSQKTMTANTTFDPAAWQLKRIQLPSGGEIHVHYEQKDYSSVQNQIPMAMVSLLPDQMVHDYKSDKSVYAINVDDINVASGDVSSYLNTLKQHFITGKNKLYFKMLFTYHGDDQPTLNAKGRRYEYVTGYTSVNDITLSSGKILFHLGDRRTDFLTGLLGSGKTDKTLPRYVAYRELLGNGGQNLGLNGGGYLNEDLTGDVYQHSPIDDNDIKAAARGKVLGNTIDMFKDWVGGLVKNVPKKDAVKSINCELSYFKIPVFHAKRGGGIRVKRILTYDPGIAGEANNADATVYGSEYIYQSEDGSSSGVAVNEPASIREENALVGFLERKKQSFIDIYENGKDTKQFEGFLGENILPNAEVVHSRIVIKNIRSGISTSGYVVDKYHTAKEFPVEVEYSDISKSAKTYKNIAFDLPIGPFSFSSNQAWVTQGYIFKLNDMNGKIASKTTYPGIYDAGAFGNPTNQSSPYTHSMPVTPVGLVFYLSQSDAHQATEPSYTSKTTYNYSKPGSKVACMVYDETNNSLTRSMLRPGTEEDFTILTTDVKENRNDFSIEVDINLSFFPPVLTLGLGAQFSVMNQRLCQHMTSKVVNQKSYLLSTTTTNDGVTQSTENLGFDKYTGDPVFTRTYDGYKSPTDSIYTSNDPGHKKRGYFYSLNVPAAWMYPALRSLSLNSANSNQLTTMAGNIVTYSTSNIYSALIQPTTATASWNIGSNTINNIVTASATTFTDNWFDASMAGDYPALSGSGTLTAVNKFYYPVRSYIYKDAVTDANATGGAIYKDGLISSGTFFDAYNSSSAPAPQWYSDSRTTRYSPYGEPIEEQDILNINSAARFGYDNTLPIAVAHNAGFNETRFSDFERDFASVTGVTQAAAHTGLHSLDLSLDQAHTFATSYPVSSQILTQKGLSIKLWLKSSQSLSPVSTLYNLKNPLPKLKAMIGSQLYDFVPVAQTGDWTLYTADIRTFNGLAVGNYNIKLSYNFLPNEQVLVDDFRIQPLDASMNCSVYYPDNRLAAQFDDQHFGVFYEYNTKGQLVRKSIETERGKKTLQEQQYNTPLIPR